MLFDACCLLCARQVPMLPPMSVFSISEVYPPKLKTEEKRAHLTLANVDKYNKALNDSGILVPEGALYLVDVHHLTQGTLLLGPLSSFWHACMHVHAAVSGLQHHTHVLHFIMQGMSARPLSLFSHACICMLLCQAMMLPQRSVTVKFCALLPA
jgi:hypothetical protein